MSIFELLKEQLSFLILPTPNFLQKESKDAPIFIHLSRKSSLNFLHFFLEIASNKFFEHNRSTPNFLQKQQKTSLNFLQKQVKVCPNYIHQEIMKRIIDYHLLEWKNRKKRKPLILRGARQVGKTYAVRQLSKSFSQFVEINLETDIKAREILEKDLDINRIVQQLSEHKNVRLIPGETLLFLDEIQYAHKALISLRYFYEVYPDLHVIAAGSLLDFAIDQAGIPVGRVTSLYMYPLSFIEFLVALGNSEWARIIISRETLFEQLHASLLDLVGLYLAIGGMPEAISAWLEEKNSGAVKAIHSGLLFTYSEDFDTYAKKHQVKYLNLIFKKASEQLSRKFMYARVGEYQKRDLEPALDMLVKAGIVNQVFSSSGQGIPLGSHADLDFFKIIFLDVGLTQALLDYDIRDWLLNPLETFINKGELVEAFIGQELLAYSDPIKKESLYFWRKSTPSSQAEVDYLIQLKGQIIPIEVKAGKSSTLKSMRLFLEFHRQSTFGIRYWSTSKNIDQQIYSYPLYAVFKPLLNQRDDLHNALSYLVK